MDIEKILDDKSKRKAYNADYYQKNKDKKKVYAHQYYLENKEDINKRNREWSKKNTARSARIFVRQKDILKILSKQRKNIGDNTYNLLIEELESTEKHTFKI